MLPHMSELTHLASVLAPRAAPSTIERWVAHLHWTTTTGPEGERVLWVILAATVAMAAWGLLAGTRARSQTRPDL